MRAPTGPRERGRRDRSGGGERRRDDNAARSPRTPAPRPAAGVPAAARLPGVQLGLEITQLGCPTCGTGLVGRFEPCDFCGLDDADLQMLKVFLASRGTVRDLERHLGVSYPTARARFDDLLRRLGLQAAPGNGQATPDAAGAATSASANGDDDGGGGDRLATLKALADGDLDVDSARARLRD